MKKPVLYIMSFALISCQPDTLEQTSVNGHVLNLAENTNLVDARIELRESTAEIQPNINVIGAVQTDANGNFTFDFAANPARAYKVSVDGDETNILVSGLYAEAGIVSASITPGQQNNVELVVGTSCEISAKLIHDMGSDSMLLMSEHMFISSAQGEKWYFGEEYDHPFNSSFSGYYIFTYHRYLSGSVTTEVDTIYFARDQNHYLEHHY